MRLQLPAEATTIVLETTRCYACRKWWAYETAHSEAVCPYCAQTDTKASGERRERAERSNRALRGVIKRMRARLV